MTSPNARQQITFPRRKSTPVSKEITHENIVDHLAAFEGAGGQVEVLGTTSTLKHIGLNTTPPAAKT